MKLKQKKKLSVLYNSDIPEIIHRRELHTNSELYSGAILYNSENSCRIYLMEKIKKCSKCNIGLNYDNVKKVGLERAQEFTRHASISSVQIYHDEIYKDEERRNVLAEVFG